MKGIRPAILLAAAAALLGLPAFAASTLAPYQMVRSLQLLQDRIAGGDHAALPMQNKLLGMIDKRMRTADTAEFEDIRNFNALLVYGMSGGNPTTLDVVLGKLTLEAPHKALGAGVLDFLRGQPTKAGEQLAAIDPMKQPIELGAFVALVKGSVIAADQPEGALKLFDQARLLVPGTLVEEAALRRSIPLAIETGNAARFLDFAGGYVRSYLRSPYASEFAQSFVDGVIAMQETIDTAAVEAVVAEMTPEQREAIYLRLARKSAIDGMPALSAFASSKVLKAEEEDPRAVLYSSMASITSETIGEIATRLKRLDRDRLSANDRKLLEAVEAVVAEVLAAPAPGLAQVAVVEGTEAAAEPPDEPGAPAETTVELVIDARRKLADVDKLLEETVE